jgi:hypothetical protein
MARCKTLKKGSIALTKVLIILLHLRRKKPQLFGCWICLRLQVERGKLTNIYGVNVRMNYSQSLAISKDTTEEVLYLTN